MTPGLCYGYTRTSFRECVMNDGRQKKSWVKPELRRLDPGSAEAKGGNGNDGSTKTGQRRS